MKISNRSCSIKTMKNPPFIKHIFCLKFGMFVDSLIAYIKVFNFFFIKIQKTTFWNILNRRFRVYPLSRFKSRNHEITSTKNRNQLTITKGNTYINYKRQHIIMCTWNINRSRTHNKIWCKKHNNYRKE